jgi:hypothetical protein
MFKVRWARAAQDELTNLWLQADSATRKAITVASQSVEIHLAANASEIGESREPSLRIVVDGPFG